MRSFDFRGFGWKTGCDIYTGAVMRIDERFLREYLLKNKDV